MSIFCGHLSQYLLLPWQEIIWLVLDLLPRVYSKPRGQSLDFLKQPWRPQGCETRSKGWSLTLRCCTIVKARQTQWQSVNTAAARNNQSWPLLTSSSSSFVEVTEFNLLQTSFCALSAVLSPGLEEEKVRKRQRWELDHPLWRNRKRTRLDFTTVLLDPIQVFTPPISSILMKTNTHLHTGTHTPLNSRSKQWCQDSLFTFPLLSPPIPSLPSDWHCCFTLPHVPGFSYEPTGQSQWLIRVQILSGFLP